MAIFVVFLVLTLVDYKMLGGSVGIIAMISGFFAIGLYVWLRLAGKTFDLSKMKDEAEMKAIQDELDKQETEAAKENMADAALSGENISDNSHEDAAQSDEPAAGEPTKNSDGTSAPTSDKTNP